MVLAVSVVAIVLLALLALVVLLVIGGTVAADRRAKAREARLKAEVEQADAALADARAIDQGWDPAQMEAAARIAWEGGHHHGEPIAELHLVQVLDRPGTDADEAVYRIVGAGGHEHDVLLQRSGAQWTPA